MFLTNFLCEDDQKNGHAEKVNKLRKPVEDVEGPIQINQKLIVMHLELLKIILHFLKTCFVEFIFAEQELGHWWK